MRPLRAGVSGPVVASLLVRDSDYEDELARIQRFSHVGRALVVFTIVVAFAGGLALLRLALKERRLSKLRTRLVANVSHELKSPDDLPD